ncbi:cation diffusion facilitator family transporter [Streptococcus acidominimus]|uniref:Cation (Co/Zn/Cd) efflux protein n=1 Tax=Streptococcus acidominimus TaxID=1326 RepID=A0A1Q8EFB6_STRAI|nr:cation diffusion facilitator family transporter [Streptococcus acidominimus]OLF50463.1 cation transporter [Streptococcus acidominimus]SUN05429.1 cation (Co/Zn/Cd) efflux protein [Streptococcus acidominimus]
MSTHKNIWIACCLNLGFAILEAVFGVLFHSSLILADAVHDAGDALAIGLSALFESYARKKADDRYTLGYKRYSLLGALLVSIILITGSLFVIRENIPKLLAPEKVDHQGMFVLALCAIAVNLVGKWMMEKGHSQHEKILSLHFLEDLLGWLLVLVLSAIFQWTDWYILDPLFSLLIAGFISYKALGQFWENIELVLEATPKGINREKLAQELETISALEAVLQLQVWTLDGLEHCAMVHIQVKDGEDMRESKRLVRIRLQDYGIRQISIECDSSSTTHGSHEQVSENILNN